MHLQFPDLVPAHLSGLSLMSEVPGIAVAALSDLSPRYLQDWLGANRRVNALSHLATFLPLLEWVN